MARVKIGNVYPTDEYLLARCAPAGYGLGGYCKNIDHWDNATACGWYSTANGSPTAATESTIWVGEVTADPLTGQITQIVRAQGKDATYEATRHFFDNRWSPWEWENPPMELGVEYRTTERYMGKPVYTMLFNMGQLANNPEGIGYYHVNSILCAQHLVESHVILADSHGIEEEAYDFRVLAIPESTVQYGYQGDKSAYTGKLFLKYTY
jgi:hypothetical protein